MFTVEGGLLQLIAWALTGICGCLYQDLFCKIRSHFLKKTCCSPAIRPNACTTFAKTVVSPETAKIRHNAKDGETSASFLLINGE